MTDPTTTDISLPFVPPGPKILNLDQCVFLLTGKPLRLEDHTSIKIPDDLADTTMVSWSLHNAVVRKLEEQRNASRSSAQDAWAEVSTLREKLKGHDDRMHKAALAREEARAERDYERKRWNDDQGVWLATRDANKSLTEEVARLRSELAKLGAPTP